MNITNIIYWLFENFTNFNSITTFLLGVATLIVTIVTARFIGQQTKVNKALFQLQNGQLQPYFIISTPLEKELEKEVYETQHFFVKNKGYLNVSVEVSKTVLFGLHKTHNTKRESVYVIVNDYFYYVPFAEPSGEIVYHAYGKGNHGKYCNLYMEALEHSGNGTYYYMDNIILVQIDYKDLLNTSHTRYFIDKEEVDERQFKEMKSKAHKESYSFKDLDYAKMQELLEQQGKNHR